MCEAPEQASGREGLGVHEAELMYRSSVGLQHRLARMFRRLDPGGVGTVAEEDLSAALLACTDLPRGDIGWLLASSGACASGRADCAAFLEWVCRDGVERAREARDAALEHQCHLAGIADLRLGRSGCSIPKTEERGISLPQLRGLLAHIARRCLPEAWMSSSPDDTGALQPSGVNLYDVVHHVVRPATRPRRCSFVELVADGPQAPRWFVSHWWGEPTADFVACLEQHGQDRRLGEGDPYWVCAYANNQWSLGDDVCSEPSTTSFHRAMRLADGTVSVLDRDAVCYQRAWCGYEVYVSLLAKDGYKYDMYTMRDTGGGAVGITDGIAEVDCWRMERYWKENQFTRERAFPTGIATGALGFRVQDARASEEADRNRILNTIAGRPALDSAPPAESARYEVVNQTLRGRFAAASWRIAFEQEAAMDIYCETLRASALPDFRMSFAGCEAFGDSAMRLLAGALPGTLVSLDLDFTSLALTSASGCHLGEALGRLQWLSTLTLTLHDNRLGKEGAAGMARGLGCLSRLSHLQIFLGRSRISDEGALHLAQSIGALQQLASLDLGLSHNSLTAEGAKSLGGSIVKLLRLRSLRLRLRDNHLQDEGAWHIGHTIQELRGQLVSLHLCLYGNQLQEEGAKFIAESVVKLEKLESLGLWLGFNYFCGEDAEAHLREELGKLPRLSKLDLDMGVGRHWC